MRGFCKGADGSISFRAAAVDRKPSGNIEFAVICPGQVRTQSLPTHALITTGKNMVSACVNRIRIMGRE